MDDPNVVAGVFAAASLEGQAPLAAARAPHVKTPPTTDTETVIARVVFDLPTVFAGDDMFFDKDRLDALQEHLLKLGALI